MDIDDLLAEVAVDSTPRETRDLQELTRCWVAERVAPEILPWPSDLMDRVLDRIRRQVSCRLLLYRERYNDNAWS
jgi:GINS complex subunit 4